MFSYFLVKLRANETYQEHAFSLEGDQHQPALMVLDRGWIDDWLLFASSWTDMRRLLELWNTTLASFGWSINADKLEIMYVSCPHEPAEFQNKPINVTTEMKWLGCLLCHTGAATAHVHFRLSKATAAWQTLVRDFDLNKLRRSAQAKLYQSIIEATLLHGCDAFPLNVNDLRLLEKFQNQVQRCFVKSSLQDVRERWIDLHSKLHKLRAEGKLPDTIKRYRLSLHKIRFSKATMALVNYRDRSWQQLRFIGKPRRRQGCPPTTLAEILACAADESF